MSKKRNLILICIIILTLVGSAKYACRSYLIKAFQLEPTAVPSRLRAFENGIIKDVILIHTTEGELDRLLQVVQTSGYGGPLTLKVIISFTNRQICDLAVLAQQESQDYGAYVSEPWFLSRFIDQHVTDVLKLQKMSAKQPGDVVAITGATITSQAVLDAVNACRENYLLIEEELK